MSASVVQLQCSCELIFDELEDVIRHIEIVHAPGEFDASDLEILEDEFNKRIRFLL